MFGAGIGALATEITASRLLAPYFGSSTIVWANLIGIVLAALALGYWLGGRIADRRPQPTLLGFIVLAAAVFVAAIPFVARPLLDLTVEGLDDASAGAVVGSFLGVLFLCAPPGGAARDGLALRDSPGGVERGDRGRGRRASLRALDRGIASRDVPPRARPDPRDRDAEDLPGRRGSPGRVVLLPPGRPLPRGRRRARGPGGRPLRVR